MTVTAISTAHHRSHEEKSRRALAAGAALVAGLAMATAGFLVAPGPTSRHPGVILRWYEQHSALLGWRALLVAVAGVAVVAFAASFRELTWTLVPERLWSGTVMVLAALGYAALTSVAAAAELAVLRLLPTGRVDAGVVAFAAHTHLLLLAVATPALIVVLLGTTLPFARLGLRGQIAAMAAGALAVALAIPLTWELARHATAVWFLAVTVVVGWPPAPHASVEAVAAARRGPAPSDADDDGFAPTG